MPLFLFQGKISLATYRRWMCACQNFYDKRELSHLFFKVIFVQNHIDLAKVYEPSNSTERGQNMNITFSKHMEQNYYVSLSLKENLLYQDKQKMLKNYGGKIQDTAGDSKSSHHRSLPNSWQNVTGRGGKCVYRAGVWESRGMAPRITDLGIS